MDAYKSDKYACAKCLEEGIVSSFDSIQDLHNHFLMCTSETVKQQCPFCNSFFENLMDHIYERHPEDKDSSREEDYQDSMIFQSKHRKPAQQSEVKECPSTVTSEDELDAIRNRISAREGINNCTTMKDQLGQKINRNQKEGVAFVDQQLKGQLLKNNVLCNGETISMGTAILKCVIETKKKDVTRQGKGLKVLKWNKERVREEIRDSGLKSVLLTNERTFGANVDKVMNQAEDCYKAMKPLGRTGGGELGDIENNEFLAPSRDEGKQDLSAEQKMWAELWEEILHLNKQLIKKVANKKNPDVKHKTNFMAQLLKPKFDDFENTEEVLDLDDGRDEINEREDRDKRAQKRSFDQRRMSTDKLRRKEFLNDSQSTSATASESELDASEQLKNALRKANKVLDEKFNGPSNNSDLEKRVSQNENHMSKMQEDVQNVKKEIVNVKKEISEVRKEVAEVKKKIVEGNKSTEEKLDKILSKLYL